MAIKILLTSLWVFYLAAIPISFEDLDLPDLIGKEIAIRGFLYQSPDGQWILAKQPDLRTCCVGRFEEQLQVVAEKELPSTRRAITLRGVLQKDAARVPVFILNQANLETESENKTGIVLFLAIISIVMILYLASQRLYRLRG